MGLGQNVEDEMRSCLVHGPQCSLARRSMVAEAIKKRTAVSLAASCSAMPLARCDREANATAQHAIEPQRRCDRVLVHRQRGDVVTRVRAAL